jgi:hypothetical protein
MVSELNIVQFPRKPYKEGYYKNTHLRIGKSKDHGIILIFVTPNAQTPYSPLDDDEYDCNGMMTLAFNNFIENPNELTFKELLKCTPIIYKIIKDTYVTCYYYNVKDKTPGFVQFSKIMKEIMDNNQFPKQIGMQEML